jgi:hypothetical protein
MEYYYFGCPSYSSSPPEREIKFFQMDFADYRLNLGQSVHMSPLDTNDMGATSITIGPTTFNISDPPVLNIVNFASVLDSNSASVWGYNGTIYGLEEFRTQARCQPLQGYRWGFSFLLLYLFATFSAWLGVMLCVLYILTQWWCDANLRSNRGADLWRVVADLAHVASTRQGDDVYKQDTRKLQQAMKGAEIRLDYDQHNGFLPAAPKARSGLTYESYSVLELPLTYTPTANDRDVGLLTTNAGEHSRDRLHGDGAA